MTAAPASRAPLSGTCAITLPVAGSATAKRAPSAASRHSDPIRLRPGSSAALPTDKDMRSSFAMWRRRRGPRHRFA
ncbi:Uncharacterised protein [Bordetella pertussis]|nr:Uncharacterised protein [Bordetella pertussis]